MELVTWSLLPAHNLQLVFANLEIIDVEKCCLVSRHWKDEANFYLKDKVCFYPSRVESIEDVIASRKRFQKISINLNYIREAKIIDILETIKQRDMKEVDAILEADIQYFNYLSLSKVLQCLGKQIKSLTLFNWLVKDKSESIFKEGSRQQYDYGCLTSVEELKISASVFDHGLLDLARNFGNLRYLKLSNGLWTTNDFLTTSLLQDFIALNPFLEYLDITSMENQNTELSVPVKALSSFENTRNLKTLRLTISCDQDFEDISENFQHLEVLYMYGVQDINFNSNYIRKVFQMPNLKNITLDLVNTFEETFSNMKNFKIMHLTLVGGDIDDNTMIACIKCLPNIKSFHDRYISSPSFKEMSNSWKHLQILNLSFDESSFQQSNVSEFGYFENLVDLTLTQNEETSMMPLFDFVKAINLKYLTLHVKVTCKQNRNELLRVFSSLSRNFPKLEFLSIFGGEEVTTALVPNLPATVRTLVVQFEERGTLYNILQSILNKKTKHIKIFINSQFIPGVNDFSNGIGFTEFRRGLLKRILVHNKEILFESF